MGLLAFVHWQRGAVFVGQATPPWAFGYAVRSGQLIPHELGLAVRRITPNALAAPIASKTTVIATMSQGLRFIGIIPIGPVAESSVDRLYPHVRACGKAIRRGSRRT